MKKILQRDHPSLREHSREVSPDEIHSEYIQGVIQDMKASMHNEDDAAAIAAPQIGENVRIFIISKMVLSEDGVGADDLVFINPKIVKVSKKKRLLEEGCLSVRWIYGDVWRHEKVTVEALNEKGQRVVYGASGIVAQAFQHEIDHLDGILFIDKALNQRDVPPEELKEEDKEHSL